MKEKSDCKMVSVCCGAEVNYSVGSTPQNDPFYGRSATERPRNTSLVPKGTPICSMCLQICSLTPEKPTVQTPPMDLAAGKKEIEKLDVSNRFKPFDRDVDEVRDIAIKINEIINYLNGK